MKSREGTVVDADDLIEEVINEARKGSSESTYFKPICREINY